MDNALDKVSCQTPSERRNLRRYLIEFLLAMAVYVGLLVLAKALRPAHDAAGLVVALLPELGIIAVTGTIVRFGLRCDELQRRVAIDAAAIAAVATVVVCMGLGFTENAGVPRLSMTWTFPIATFIWGVTLPFMRKRYA